MVVKLKSCPQCKKLTPYEGNAYRPFCSKRCKMIDLGEWATQGYAIPGETSEFEANNVAYLWSESEESSNS